MQDTSMYADGGNIPLPAAEPSEIAVTAAPSGARTGSDRVQAAFVSLAVARLERDHVALLAALCDLERERRASAAAGTQVMQEALTAVLREELRQTQRALERASAGTLGYCERCQAPLTITVLLAQPATTHCPGCTAAVERGTQIH